MALGPDPGCRQRHRLSREQPLPALGIVRLARDAAYFCAALMACAASLRRRRCRTR